MKMSDFINRKDALDEISKIDTTIIPSEWIKGYVDETIKETQRIIRAIPSAKHEERTAKVISDDVIITVNGYRYHYEEYFCNACKKKVFSCDPYCSHCGAKLDWSWNE